MKIIDFKVKRVTYEELAKALINLGFEDKSDKKYFRFFHQKKDTKVLLPQGKKTAILDKTPLAATALILKGRNIIKKTIVLEQLIERNRILAQEVVA